MRRTMAAPGRAWYVDRPFCGGGWAEGVEGRVLHGELGGDAREAVPAELVAALGEP
jgi:hypothetical protein